MIHLVEGPVGAGKSTYAARLGLDLAAPRLDLDEWMVVLFRPDRPETDFTQWYLERKDRCLSQIWNVASEIIASGSDCVLELGLVGRGDRAAFYERADAADYGRAVYLVDAPEETRRQRVRERNQLQSGTFKMAVSDEIFDIANRAWEPPDETECDERRIRIVHTPADGSAS
ncbi:MAG: ATP-binding protein [Gammaproteobacteria bacterium]|nr:ATP-binding protein [Gammaproteobacteria bacterium]